MTSKEEIADYSDDLAVGGLGPQPAQVCDGVDHLLFPFHHIFEAVKWELMLLKKASNLPLVLLDEGNYALPEVFRDVLCLILRSSLHFSLLFGLLGNFLCFDSLYFLRVLFDAKNMLLGLLGKLQVCDVLGLWRDVLLQVFLILAASLILKCREIHDMKILKRLRCEQFQAVVCHLADLVFEIVDHMLRDFCYQIDLLYVKLNKNQKCIRGIICYYVTVMQQKQKNEGRELEGIEEEEYMEGFGKEE